MLHREDTCHMALGFFGVLGFGGRPEAARGLPIAASSGQRLIAAPVTEEASSKGAGTRGWRLTGPTQMNSTGSDCEVGWGFRSYGPCRSPPTYRRRRGLDPGTAPGRPQIPCPAQWTLQTTTRPWGSSGEEPGRGWEGPQDEVSFGPSSAIAGL